jgi:hypothetical protein
MTTINEMNCETFSDQLMVYMERELDDGTRASLERHAHGCVDCGALLADLRQLRVGAANLPELAPSRDLWSGIAARIEAPVVPIGPMRHELQRRSLPRRWMRRVLLAASLVAAAGVGYLVAVSGGSMRGANEIAQLPLDTLLPPVAPDSNTVRAQPQQPRTPSPDEPRLPGPAPRQLATAPAPAPAQLAVATLTADYNREVARLRVLIEQRRNQLDPVTVAIIDKNLQVIDAAIAECQRAIVRDPASRFLIESLNQSFQTKVELMRTAALLPSRT